MPTYSPKPSEYSGISFSHPSVESQKPVSPNVTISENGLMTVDRKISRPFKSGKAPNSAVASQDVATNGTHEIKSFAPIAANNPVKTRNLPQVEQLSGICQTIPYLHIIQSQLNFDMDYDSLWQCIPTNLTGSVMPDLLAIIGFSPAYSKLYNLLFSGPGTCFSVGEIPKKCNVADEVQEVGGANDNSHGCDSVCSRRIKITTVSTPTINSEKELADRLNDLGPMLMGSRTASTHKLTVLSENKDLTWNDVKDMSFTQLNNLLSDEYKFSFFERSGHAVTLMSHTNGVFTVRNSWDGEKEFQLSWPDIQQYFDINGSIMQDLYGVPINRYYPIVEECEYIGDRNGKTCKDIHCIESGYDGAKPNSNPDECECYCKSVVAPATLPNASYMNCLNVGQTVEKELLYGTSAPDYSFSKKCRCPEHSQPDKYYYIEPDCCERPWNGTWCQRYYCEETKLFYMNGIQRSGSSREYEQEDERAVAWETRPSLPRKVPCVKEEAPKVCSGAYESSLPHIITFSSLYNIVQVNEINLS